MRKLALMMIPLAVCVTASPASGGETDDIARLVYMLGERLPGLTPEDVRPSPVDGIYEVGIGGQVVYVTADARHVFAGKLIEWETGRDLTEGALASRRLELLAEVPESKMIIFEPKGDTKHTVTTFTDIDCPYCRKMHSEMAELNGYGIRVRYLLFPRTGVGSVSYRKAVSVWCAEDQREEMTRAKRGEMPKRRECANPVVEHMTLAETLGLAGTPMTITDTGEQIMGYVPAAQLLERMEHAKGSR